MCAGVGSGGRFRKVPESSGVCWWFRRVLACAGGGSGGRFRKVPESSGVCYCRLCYRRFRRQVLESSGVRWCRYRRQGSEGSEKLRCGLLLCNLVRGSHVIVLNTFW